jgi:hypothetical protein
MVRGCIQQQQQQQQQQEEMVEALLAQPDHVCPRAGAGATRPLRMPRPLLATAHPACLPLLLNTCQHTMGLRRAVVGR